MKFKTIKQHIKEFSEQLELGQSPDPELMIAVKKALKDKKASYQHKLRHGAHFVKRERAEKKLKKIKAYLKELESLHE